MRKLIVAVIAVFSTACSDMPKYQPTKAEGPIQVVISVREPSIRQSDNTDSFVLDVDTLHITSEWGAISGKPVYYRCEIYDGKGSLAFEMGGRLLTKETLLYHSSYSPTSSTDESGIWKIILYANDQIVATRKIIGRKPTEIALIKRLGRSTNKS